MSAFFFGGVAFSLAGSDWSRYHGGDLLASESL